MATNQASQIKLVKKRIVPVAQTSPYIRALFYGYNGRGKTRLAATGPGCLVVDINEKGTKSIRSYTGVDLFETEKWEDVTYLYWFLRSGDHSYETVVIDTATSLADVCLSHVLKEAGDRDPLRDPATASQRDWGKVAKLMGDLILRYRNLPMHVVFLAQVRAVDDEESGETLKVPDLSPKPRGILMSAVDIIGYLYKTEVRVVNKKTRREAKDWETRLLTGPHNIYPTKDQTGALPRIMREPTMPEIIELNNGGNHG